jgi:hypothetical protein
MTPKGTRLEPSKAIAVRLLGAALALACALPAFAEREARIGLPNRGALLIKLPDGWREEVARPDPASPPAILVTPEAGTAFKMLLQPNWPKDGKGKLPDPAAIREVLTAGSKAAASVAVEKTISIQDLRAPMVAGSYYSITDRAPEPGDYKHISQGMVRVGNIVVAFQVLNNGDPKVLEAALNLIRSLRHV